MYDHEDEEKGMIEISPDKGGRSLAKRSERNIQAYLEQENSGDNQTESGIDFKALWAVIVKRKWTAITFFLIVTVSATISSFMMTPIFSSTVVLQIGREESNIVKYEDVKTSSSLSPMSEFYTTQHEILKSRLLASRVITKLDLWNMSDSKPNGSNGENEAQSNEKYRDRVIDSFLQGLTVSPVRNSMLVKVSYESANSILAERISNIIAEEYVNLNLERRMGATTYAKAFLGDQLEQIRARLEESEKELAAYSRSLGVVKDNNSSEISTDSQVFNDYTAALSQIEQERIKAESIYKQMQRSGGASLSVVLDNPVIQLLKSKKSSLEVEYQESLQIYKPDFPLMLQKKGQIEEIQRKIDEEVLSIKKSLQINYEAVKAEEEALRAKRDEAKELILSVQDRGTRYSVIKREVDTNRQLYEGLLQRMKEVSVAGGVGLNNISVIDRARVADHPIKPKKSLIILIFSFIGMIGGIFLVLFIEMLDDTIKGADAFEKMFSLPVLGIIPELKIKQELNQPNHIHTENMNSRSVISEAFRSLRTSIQFTTSEGAPKVTLFTSARPSEGKSTTSLSVAIQFAQAGKKVLIVDLDLRKASLHKVLGISNDWGITNYLAGDAQPAEITRSASIENLYIVPSGPLPPNPAELISSGKMFSFLSLAVDKFDIVIIDGPPVLGLADAPLLGNLADATVLIVEAGVTRVEHIRDALKRLKSSHSKIIGGVLTKVNTRHSSYGYDAYYQYGK